MNRILSLEKDFMNIDVDDLLYGILLHDAEYDKDNNELYITKAQYNSKRKFIYSICDLDSRKLKRRIQILSNKGLLEIGYKNDKEVLFLKNKYEGKFQPIDYEMLEYLFLTRNRFVIKIYIYLLNKYLWKKAQGEYYSFTLKEIQQAIGFSNATNFSVNPITIVLESLTREGVIRYEDYYEEKCANNSIIPIPKKKLLYVAKNIKEQD